VGSNPWNGGAVSRDAVPVFSERLKKFKSNANEDEELNILAKKCGRGEGKAAEECETSLPSVRSEERRAARNFAKWQERRHCHAEN
jgi:hypothetical protein